MNAIFRWLDHDDDQCLSYTEFRDALTSHLSYIAAAPLLRDVVVTSSPYWSPYRTYLAASPYRSVYWSPYWEPLYRSYVSPYRSYYPYYSPSRVRQDMSYESPTQFRSP